MDLFQLPCDEVIEQLVHYYFFIVLLIPQLLDMVDHLLIVAYVFLPDSIAGQHDKIISWSSLEFYNIGEGRHCLLLVAAIREVLVLKVSEGAR